MPSLLFEAKQKTLIFSFVILILMFSLLALGLFFSLLSKGIGGISLDYIFSEPLSSGRAGGIAPIIISTLLIVVVAIVVSAFIGITSGIALSEIKLTPKVTSFVRVVLNSLAAVPSVIFGLFGASFFCIYCGLGFSILAGGLTLALMVLPLIISSVFESLQSISKETRMSASALGISEQTAIHKIYLPSVSSGISVAILLGMGRAFGETAALLFTSGYVDRYPESLFDSGRALSVHIFDLSMNIAGGEQNAYASSLVLIIIVFFLYFFAKLIPGNKC